MDLKSFEQDLTERMGTSDGVRPDLLARSLASIATPYFVRDLLASVLLDESYLHDTARKSYAHPNGFTKIVLISQPRFQLRLHLWHRSEDEVRSPAENAHNHRWNFSTAILSGGYRYQEYRADDEGESFYSYSYEACRGAGRYALMPTGTRRLGCVFDAYLPAGSVYTLTADVVHRVSCDRNRNTVSLVLQGPRARPTVEVYANRIIASGASLPLLPLSPEFLAGEVAALLQAPDILIRQR